MSILGKLAAQLRSAPAAAAAYLDERLAALEDGGTGLQLASAAPANVTKAAAAVGVGTTAARADHKHDITTAAPSNVGVANAEGSASSLARSDHVHANNIRRGQATLASGTVTVANASITTNSRVIPILVTPGAGVSGTRYAVSYSVGVSFTITAKDSAAGNNTVATDNSVLDYVIVEAST